MLVTEEWEDTWLEEAWTGEVWLNVTGINGDSLGRLS